MGKKNPPTLLVTLEQRLNFSPPNQTWGHILASVSSEHLLSKEP